ncbi:HEPN domain-containing protein, partial [Candidatus Sumerlaeota bacterium]|nr:HEPN domain-containing protein [Candidatus Sumerlaeota bacterium]
MKEIRSLIERAKKYLRSAEILLKEGDYESSVSRTYYA